ncbi:uncharacterized protein ARMOST_15619 [Armillaria ostoyae]|uniref:Uncharacterized protein n=1 Tax=Armillaria ostoyae TaxID=47428 RepID=A0A284RTW9_ARMOS|nr:uncharacterized protein ARMOST_15619 [Armillaria ostoyae]
MTRLTRIFKSLGSSLNEIPAPVPSSIVQRGAHAGLRTRSVAVEPFSVLGFIRQYHSIAKSPVLESSVSPAIHETGSEREWIIHTPSNINDTRRGYFVQPDIEEAEMCIEMAMRGRFPLLLGPQGSGRTMRLLDIKSRLEEYTVIHLSLKDLQITEDLKTFWDSVYRLVCMRVHDVPPFTHGNDFTAHFRVKEKDERFFLLVDDIDELRAASSDVVHDFLGTLRFLQECRRTDYSLDGLIATGTLSALSTSLIVYKGTQIPYFSFPQVESLFHDFQKDNHFTLNPDIVKEIWINSGGHPATVCLCGQFIRDKLLSSNDSQNVTFAHWQQNTVHELYEWFGRHPTYKKMLQSLQDPDAHDAVALLYHYFLGYLGPVYVGSQKEKNLADFLTAEGVLHRLDRLRSEYQMSSAFVDGFLRTKLIPVKFPAPHPLASPVVNNDVIVVDILRTALRFFNRNLLQAACSKSCKIVDVPVCSHRGERVLDQGVYETELARVLSSWLGSSDTWSVDVEWHSYFDGIHPNIILTKGTPIERTVILEVAATSDAVSVQSQISRAIKYKDLLGADEVWLVHMTREDDYKPVWQSSDELARGMNVVHLQHDLRFFNITMNARWRDSKGQDCQIMNEVIESK